MGRPKGIPNSADRFGDGNNRSTQRAEWARGLGKGCAHARDGQAWTAAISGANCAFYCAIESAIDRDKAMHAAWRAPASAPAPAAATAPAPGGAQMTGGAAGETAENFKEVR